MKALFLAASVAAISATTAFAFDDDNHRTRLAVSSGSRIIMHEQGPVIEVRGQDGERTIHIERDGDDSTLHINGQEIEVRNGAVLVDGQAVDADEGSVVIIEGAEIRVVDSDDAIVFGPEFARHIGERAEAIALMHGNGTRFEFDFDADEYEGDIHAALTAALSGLEGGEIHLSDDWDELSEEEREEVREALREAHERLAEVHGNMRIEFTARHDDHARRMAEHAAEMAELQIEMANVHVDVDLEEVHAEALRSVEAALTGLDDENNRIVNGRDWEDLSEEEQEEVRESLREAREEMRETLRELRVEMREVEREQVEARRHVQIEMRRVERDMERARRDMERAERDIERAQREISRERERSERRHVMRWRQAENRFPTRELTGETEGRDIRIEEDDDGRRRVWVGGEEQTGDDLIDWLNRLESERLAGGNEAMPHGAPHVERRVMRFESDGDAPRVIELDDERRVFVLVDGEGENTMTWEVIIDDEDED